jgi:hypothetical protein
LELHSLASEHGWLFAFFPQLPSMQVLGDTQSLSAVHVVRHAFVAGSQLNGSQSELVTDRQTPAPSQVRCGVCVDPVHAGAAHCVPTAQTRQAPAPLHVPSSPHVVDDDGGHWAAAVGPLPFAT